MLFRSSRGVVSHQVKAAPTSVTVSSGTNPSRSGDPVTFTATVAANPAAGTPDGQVSFMVDGVAVGGTVLLDDGKAVSGPVSSLPVGDHQVTAKYSGSSGFTESGSAIRQTVNALLEVVRPTPTFKVESSSATLDRRGVIEVQFFCTGDPFSECRGVAAVTNSRAVRVAKRGRRGTSRARPGRLLAKGTVAAEGGKIVTVRFRLNRFGTRVFKATKRVPTWVKVTPSTGTGGVPPQRVMVKSRVKRRR